MRYPEGNFGLVLEREKMITARKYFNQRVLNADGRFAKTSSTCWRHSTLWKTSKSRIRSALCCDRFGEDCTKDRTAGAIKNKQVLQKMVQRDDAFPCPEECEGSPAYFQAVQYNVLAIIRQLGLPTWFLTLSAADMQWPDVIQTIAR